MQSRFLTRAPLAGALALLLGGCAPGDEAQASNYMDKSVARDSEEWPRPLTEASIQQIYWRSCHSCHGSGVGGAPRASDTVAWAPRLAKGMDTLVANAMNGYRAMPPRGLCFDCSREEFVALIELMSRSGGVQAID